MTVWHDYLLISNKVVVCGIQFLMTETSSVKKYHNMSLTSKSRKSTAIQMAPPVSCIVNATSCETDDQMSWHFSAISSIESNSFARHVGEDTIFRILHAISNTEPLP